MRIKLTLAPETRDGVAVLPINYQYELSGWIYHTLNEGNAEFTNWLHSNGYADGNKAFRLFTFSNLILQRFRIEGDRLLISADSVHLYISFYPIKALETFVAGVFRDQHFVLGDRHSQVPFTVTAVESCAEPQFSNTMQFKTLSPIILSQPMNGERGTPSYMMPGDEGYLFRLIDNLKEKYKAFYGKPFTEPDGLLSFVLHDSPRRKIIAIKQHTHQETKLRAYECRFTISAPVELLKLGYYGGFGEKGAMGMGCMDIEKKLFRVC